MFSLLPRANIVDMYCYKDIKRHKEYSAAKSHLGPFEAALSCYKKKKKFILMMCF